MAYYCYGTSLHPRHCPYFEPDEADVFDSKLEAMRVMTRKEWLLYAYKNSSDQLKVISKHKTLPDIFTVDSFLVVSKRFKELSEYLEPGAHLFRELEIKRKDGSLFDSHYFYFHIDSIVSAVNKSMSNIYERKRPDDDGYENVQWPPGSPLYLIKENVAGLHTWRDEYMIMQLYFSNEIYRAFKKNKITGFDHLDFADEV